MASSEAEASSGTPTASVEAPPVELDGNYMGGGGQILRNSVALSALLRKPLRITSIRADKSPPGMRTQHVRGFQLVSNLCSGHLVGAFVRSSEVLFRPGEIRPAAGAVGAAADLLIDLQTAASIYLVIQAILPVLLFQPPPPAAADSSASTPFSSRPSVVTIIGGTNATLAPQMDYFINVLLPILEKMVGVGRVRVTVLKRGYFPAGGGQVRLEVMPLLPGQWIDAIDLTERGVVTKLCGYIFAGGRIPIAIAQDMYGQVVSDLEYEIRKSRTRNPEFEAEFMVVEESNASGDGSGLTLWAETSNGCLVAGSALEGEAKKGRGTGAKNVAEEATSKLKATLAAGVCVDEYLQDQLIIFMALAKGRSRLLTTSLTLHTQTVMWVVSELSGVEFIVQQLNDGLTVLIECDGMGFTYSFPP